MFIIIKIIDKICDVKIFGMRLLLAICFFEYILYTRYKKPFEDLFDSVTLPLDT